MKSKNNSKLREWQNRCKSGQEICAKCGETRFLTVDHIVPLFILGQFALEQHYIVEEMEENFEILCKWCNGQKRHLIDPRNPKVYLILRKVLDMAEAEAIIGLIK